MAQYGNEINATEAILQSIPTPNRISNNYEYNNDSIHSMVFS
jgi:hypothetical protein